MTQKNELKNKDGCKLSAPVHCYISFEYVHLLRESMRQINRLDFNNIVWTKDGKPIDIPEDKKHKWNLIGLNNTDFPECYEEI